MKANYQPTDLSHGQGHQKSGTLSKKMSADKNTFADFLRKSATKLEELQVKASLGKAEFSDKLEEMKKETLSHISRVKAETNAMADRGKEKLEEYRAKLQHLEVQLALGKAETKEELEKQSKKISEALHKLKQSLS